MSGQKEALSPHYNIDNNMMNTGTFLTDEKKKLKPTTKRQERSVVIQ